MASKDLETFLAHDGRYAEGAVVPPVYQTSLFTFTSIEDMEDAFAGLGMTPRPMYSRMNNPTVMTLEAKLAQLEGGEAARAFSSGMAAISTSVLSRVRSGDRIVCVRNVYPGTFRLFTQLLPRFGITVDFVDGQNPEAVADVLPSSRLLYLESPTSHTFQLQDLAELTELARSHGVFTIADNSWATPVFQRPLDHGVDMVVHSASKYLGGHSDVVAGVAVGSRADIDKLNGLEFVVLGGKLSPLEAALLMRSLRTLPLRMRQHQQSALELARRLVAHPLVEEVNHPYLDTHPQHELAKRYLHGASSLFSIRLRGNSDTVRRFVNALGLFRLGVSWGGHESLAFPAMLGFLEPGSQNPYRLFEVPEQLVRLYVGLEATEDLWCDLQEALETASVT